jgi:hypothetical protein
LCGPHIAEHECFNTLLLLMMHTQTSLGPSSASSNNSSIGGDGHVPRLRRRVAQENGDGTDDTIDDSARYSAAQRHQL